MSTAEEMALRETLELDQSLLDALGRGLDLLVLNRMLPDVSETHGAEPWLALWQRRAALQNERAAALAKNWRRPLVRLPLSACEGPAAVAELERSLVDGVRA